MTFKCSYCGRAMLEGTGKLYAKTDGKLFYFCSRRCEQGMIKLNRKPRKVRWTLASRIGRGKARAED
ncbi:MAG TPA: 50S ribosomal protein L24e [Candidatus Nanoarchaeia archaeon]|nr:50S ribosomal protein L24e [Candidatus Nanoarchaeia archaeon]